MLQWLFGKKKEEEPKKSKPSAEQEAEDKWKYDFIVQFLSGPLWKTSLLDFVDYHCVVFDNEEENKFEYTTIHNKFKQLVASLFDGMMQQVGLDDEKLAELLDKGFNSKHKKIFNQLLLADDFLRFKQLMLNRNKTLEAEAIKALNQQKHSKKQQASRSPKQPASASEEAILKESVRAEQERLKKLQQEEEQQLRRVLQMSQKQAEEQEMIKKLQAKVAQTQIKETKPHQPELEAPKVQTTVASPQKPAKTTESTVEPVWMPKSKKNPQPLEPLPPLRQQRKIQQSPLKKQAPQEQVQPVVHQQTKPEVSSPEPKHEEAEVQSQEDRKRRLMEQRQRIRRKKEEERRKQMAEEESKPAPAQTIVLQEDGIHETHVAMVQEQKVSNAEIERRRELMKKIKNRIIDDF